MKIAGTAHTLKGEQPFIYDTVVGTLSLGFDAPDRKPTIPTDDHLQALETALQSQLGVGLDVTAIGEFRCYDCNLWHNVHEDPGAWSLGMCLSCSMDRSNEIAGRD